MEDKLNWRKCSVYISNRSKNKVEIVPAKISNKLSKYNIAGRLLARLGKYEIGVPLGYETAGEARLCLSGKNFGTGIPALPATNINAGVIYTVFCSIYKIT